MLWDWQSLPPPTIGLDCASRYQRYNPIPDSIGDSALRLQGQRLDHAVAMVERHLVVGRLEADVMPTNIVGHEQIEVFGRQLAGGIGGEIFRLSGESYPYQCAHRG